MIEFTMTLVFVYILYYIMNIRKYDKEGNFKATKKSKDQPKIPIEVELLIRKYRVDISKLNYRGLLKLVGFVCALDIALIVATVINIAIDNVVIKIIIGGLLTIPVIMISYAIMGNYFKKKGLVIKNDRNK